jgi:hypothetical protein
MVIVVAFIWKGKEGFFSVLKMMFYLLLVATIIFAVGVIIYNLFFKKQRVDVTYKFKQGLIRSGKLSKPHFMEELWCKGDKTHQAVKIGKIIGYCRIENYAGRVGEKKDPNRKESTLKRQEDVFIVQTAGFVMSFFIDPLVIRVAVEDWEGLSKVYLNGINLIEINQYYYLNKDVLDYDRIDATIKGEALRYVVLDAYSDFQTIVKKAEGLDTDFSKDMDSKKLLKIPQVKEEQ